MEENANELLKELNKEYILAVKQFIQALKENAPPRELVTIRNNAKQLFYKLVKGSEINNSEKTVQ